MYLKMVPAGMIPIDESAGVTGMVDRTVSPDAMRGADSEDE